MSAGYANGRLPPRTRPKIVCLCGSTKFKDTFLAVNKQETLAGNIVLSVGAFMHADDEDYASTPEIKIKLDVLHKRKIDISDEVVVLNVNGYIGSSTKSEIEHATKLGKPIRYLYPEKI